ncbi:MULTISPECIES: hypothetical protein [unclassified Streptomyces]|uniref:hypothetical protein n=1 Tax=unclassified Streptomyces TaxID=2593676 RepID=UPI0033BAE60D
MRRATHQTIARRLESWGYLPATLDGAPCPFDERPDCGHFTVEDGAEVHAPGKVLLTARDDDWFMTLYDMRQSLERVGYACEASKYDDATLVRWATAEERAARRNAVRRRSAELLAVLLPDPPPAEADTPTLF